MRLKAFILEGVRSARGLSRRQVGFLSKTFSGKLTGEFQTERQAKVRKLLSRLCYNAAFALLLALLLNQSDRSSSTLLLLAPGDIVEQDIISPMTAEIEPAEVNQRHKEELAKNVAPVFDYDDTALEAWLRRWISAFRRIRNELYSAKVPPKSPVFFDSLNQRLSELTGQTLSRKDLLFLHQNKFGPKVEVSFEQVARLASNKLIAPSNLFPTYYNTGIAVRLVNQSLRETVIHDVSRIWSLDQTREWLLQTVTRTPPVRMENAARYADLVNAVLIPNLRFNEQVTENRIAQAISRAKHTLYSLRRGQVIAHRGERVTEDLAALLENLKRMTSISSSIKRFFLTFTLLLTFLTVLFRVSITGRGMWYLSLKDATFFLVISLLNIAVVKIVLPYLRLFFAPLNVTYGVEYFLPISAGGIIIHLMMGKEAAFTYALLVSTVLGYFLDQNFFFTVWCFAVTVTAVQVIRSCKQRTDLYKCGAASGLVGAILVAVFCLIHVIGFKTIDWASVVLTVTLSFSSGMMAAVSTSSLIPMLESLFGYTTSLKLLELSNFNHPLLHTLMMKAPGTYHHSVMVGSLAEIAADRIKANSLLARVSAYYHDIGKMNKPLYFIENQSPNANLHDHLQPSMSAKILFSHVKDGVRLGREHNLGVKITDIIQQHHGTTLVSYFFNKAKSLEKPDVDTVEDSQFRYPGPRPQTREAAIVMIADACEASTRSIAEPTPAKIQTMVHNIINKRFLEEQFSECDLTLSDLRVIEESFTRTLVSLYHHRIEYPNQRMEMVRTAGGASSPSAPRARTGATQNK